MLLFAGVAVLALGAWLLVRGIGWAGVCGPVLVVALAAVADDRPALALGTVLGANIANIGLVLGLAAVVRPLRGTSPLVSAALPLVLVSTLLVWFVVGDNVLSRGDAVVLLLASAGVVAYLRPAVVAPSRRGAGFALLGVMVLVGGAILTVRGAAETARFVGASSLMMGLTAVAAGASLPAAVVAVRATRRGESDAVLGTVIGSNIFGSLFVLGATALVTPLRLSDGIVMQELPAVALFALLLLPCLANGLRVSRWEGAILLAAYLGFVAWQVTTAVK